jgi:hypothetical protein
MPVTINGTTGLIGNSVGTHTGAVLGDVTSTGQSIFNDIKLQDEIVNSNNSPILTQQAQILQLKYYEYDDQFTNGQLRVYEIYHEESIVQKGNYSTFRLEADIFGYQVATAGHRGNVGFNVSIYGPGNQGWIWADRIYGTDGANGDTWKGFYYQGNVHRTVLWQSPWLAGQTLAFQLIVGGYDAAATIWNYGQGYANTAHFNITEYAETQYPRVQ